MQHNWVVRIEKAYNLWLSGSFNAAFGLFYGTFCATIVLVGFFALFSRSRLHIFRSSPWMQHILWKLVRPSLLPLVSRSQGEFIFVFNFPFMLQLLESFLIQSYGVWNWISRVPFILVGVSRRRCNFIRAQNSCWTFTFRVMQAFIATTMCDQESAESFWEFR